MNVDPIDDAAQPPVRRHQQVAAVQVGVNDHQWLGVGWPRPLVELAEQAYDDVVRQQAIALPARQLAARGAPAPLDVEASELVRRQRHRNLGDGKSVQDSHEIREARGERCPLVVIELGVADGHPGYELVPEESPAFLAIEHAAPLRHRDRGWQLRREPRQELHFQLERAR